MRSCCVKSLCLSLRFLVTEILIVISYFFCICAALPGGDEAVKKEEAQENEFSWPWSKDKDKDKVCVH